MTSDDQRREVAKTLRGLSEGDSFAAETLERDVYYDALVLRAIRASVGRGDIFPLLADLIDRPTCQMVECSIDHGSRSWGMRCTACGKEFEHVKPSYGWSYCPNCGAVVTEKGVER